MTVLLDVTGLLLRRDEAVMTGIDRVDYALARQLCGPTVDDRFGAAFLVRTPWMRGVVDRPAMHRELDRMASRRALAQHGHDLLAQVAQALAAPAVPRDGPGVLRLGAAGRRRGGKVAARLSTGLTALAHGGGLRRMMRRAGEGLHFVHASHHALEHGRRFEWAVAAGVRSTVFVHDLIPLDHPTFCSAGARASHGPKLETAARLAGAHPLGRIAVNSHHTRGRVGEWLARRGLAVPRIEVHRLGTGPLAGRRGAAAIDLARVRPYFVCAGTMEGRKNVALLLAVWRRLLAAPAVSHVPALVLAGARGWSCADVLADLDTARDIAPHVVEVAGLGDAELEALVDGARAVLTPSLAEGFSLVPAEALARGVPVLASDIPAHRELGGAITLLPPREADSWCAAVQRLCGPRPPRVAAPGPERSWSDFAAGLLG